MGCCQSSANTTKDNTSQVKKEDGDEEQVEVVDEGLDVGLKDAEEKKTTEASSSAGASSTSGKKQYSWDKREKVNKEDIRFKDETDKVLFKKPGDLKGSEFKLDNCKNCDIFVLDKTSEIYADDLDNCRIFIGPTTGSVFIRTSKNCTIVTLCQQLRTRDCENIDFVLFCQTQPSIETSTGLRFSCITPEYQYAELDKQMFKAKLDICRNQWFRIYDFNPGSNTYKILESGVGPKQALIDFPEESGVVRSESFIVPHTMSPDEAMTNEFNSCFVVVAADRNDDVFKVLLNKACNEHGMRIAEIGRFSLKAENGKEKLNGIFGNDDIEIDEDMLTAFTFKRKMVTGVMLVGEEEDLHEPLQAIADELKAEDADNHIWVAKNLQESQTAGGPFFEFANQDIAV